MPTIIIDGKSFDLRRATPAEIIDLRWRILRSGLAREEAMFADDDRPASLHYAAAVKSGHIACCATFHLNEWEGQPAYQLRGMATDEGYRGLGLGSGLLQLAETEISEATPVRMLWCNARTPALPFYLKQGWVVRSERFEIPTAGTHVRMSREL